MGGCQKVLLRHGSYSNLGQGSHLAGLDDDIPALTAAAAVCRLHLALGLASP